MQSAASNMLGFSHGDELYWFIRTYCPGEGAPLGTKLGASEGRSEGRELCWALGTGLALAGMALTIDIAGMTLGLLLGTSGVALGTIDGASLGRVDPLGDGAEDRSRDGALDGDAVSLSQMNGHCLSPVTSSGIEN
jgi:hypothetical protein